MALAARFSELATRALRRRDPASKRTCSASNDRCTVRQCRRPSGTARRGRSRFLQYGASIIDSAIGSDEVDETLALNASCSPCTLTSALTSPMSSNALALFLSVALLAASDHARPNAS